MSMRKALGIVVFSTQAVVVFDYNMQSQKAGLAPGALSMKEYAAIVQKRYETPDSGRVADLGGTTEPETPALARILTSAPERTEAAQLASPDTPTAICIRRGTALSCQ